MKTIIYVLKEKSFEQPSYMEQSMGRKVRSHVVDKTTSKKKAEAWAKKSGLNFYEII